MANHAKPTYASSLRKHGARGTAALAVAAAGLLAAGPLASAGEGSHHPHPNDDDKSAEYIEANEESDSQGIINVSDNNAQVPVQACNNYVPVNVLGVQVPLEDIAGNIPIGSEGDNGADNGDEACAQGSAQEN